MQAIHAQSCTPSDCLPEKIVFQRMQQTGLSGINGCIAHIDVFEEDLLGGSVGFVSVLQPIRAVPIIGEAIEAIPLGIGHAIRAEKWAAAVASAVDGQISYEDAAWTIITDVASEEAGKAIIDKALKVTGRTMPRTLEEALDNAIITPVLNELADSLKEYADDWVKLHLYSRSWQYASLQHCVDTGQLTCYPNYSEFIQVYPETFNFLEKTQVLFCGELMDSFTFVSDVTIPDGTLLPPQKPFRKVWRIQNTGTSTWGTGYELVFVGGTRLSVDTIVISSSVAPGETVDLSVNL
jgi:hypothetical protein